MNRLRHASAWATSALFFLAAPTQAQTVLRVGGSGPFADIASAVAAAQSGDTVLVAPGEYAGATITTALTLVADGTVRLEGSLLIQSIGAGQTVVVSGFDLSRDPMSIDTARISASNCQGQVVLQDIAPFLYSPVDVTDCDDVVISNCTLISDECVFRHGLSATRSTVAVYDSTLHGVLFNNCADGGDGLVLVDSSVFAMNCSFRGGFGRDPGLFDPGGAPGRAMILTNSTLTSVDSVAEIAQGTDSTLPPLLDALSAWNQQGGDADLLAAPFVARPGDVATITAEGTAGNLVVLGLAFGQDRTDVPFVRGPILMDLGFAPIPLGAIPAAGMIQLLTNVGNPPGGGPAFDTVLQTIVLNPSTGSLTAGTARTLTMLSGSI